MLFWINRSVFALRSLSTANLRTPEIQELCLSLNSIIVRRHMFLPPIKLYNWNIVESGVKHHKPSLLNKIQIFLSNGDKMPKIPVARERHMVYDYIWIIHSSKHLSMTYQWFQLVLLVIQRTVYNRSHCLCCVKHHKPSLLNKIQIFLSNGDKMPKIPVAPSIIKPQDVRIRELLLSLRSL
jgi:hypothetical protein